jgi:hypothetical protein
LATFSSAWNSRASASPEGVFGAEQAGCGQQGQHDQQHGHQQQTAPHHPTTEQATPARCGKGRRQAGIQRRALGPLDEADVQMLEGGWRSDV